MSNYTTQIRFICESKSGLSESVGFNGIMAAIEGSVDEIFNFEWPIFDEAYRVPLEIKILRHFYTREIGEETFGLWQLRLADRLNVIMPYYNKLYESELIKFNPMWDVDVHTEYNKTNDGESNTDNRSQTDKNDSRNRELLKNDNSNGNSVTDFSGNRENISSVDQNENIKRDSVTDTKNVGIWDSETARSNVANGETMSENTRKNKNVNRYSDTPQGNVNIGNALAGSTGGTDGNVDTESVFGNGYLTNVTIVDDKTDREGKERTQNTNDSVEQGKTTQDWTKQDAIKGASDRNLSGLQEDNTKDKSKTVVRNDNASNGSENEGVTGEESTKFSGSTEVNNYNTEDFIQHVFGKRGGVSYSKMLDEFRKTFLNIDRMILNELDSLFIGLWE